MINCVTDRRSVLACECVSEVSCYETGLSNPSVSHNHTLDGWYSISNIHVRQSVRIEQLHGERIVAATVAYIYLCSVNLIYIYVVVGKFGPYCYFISHSYSYLTF